ncbi:hypothetical protein B0H19DRAFT_1260467 [Mycena capillaripes]|nr:hypothetical protein B0H19DRAFT_1260467 [Mycena capillaripes]
MVERRSATRSPSKNDFPVLTPALPVVGVGDWANAVVRPKKFIAGLTLEEKINVTRGIDVEGPVSAILVFNVHSLASIFSLRTDLEWRANDPPSSLERPLPPRLTSSSSVWRRQADGRRVPRDARELAMMNMGVSAAPSFYQTFILTSAEGRQAVAGRNWEGFGADSFPSGVATATINGIQSNGVITLLITYVDLVSTPVSAFPYHADSCSGRAMIFRHPSFIATLRFDHLRGGSEASQMDSSNIDDEMFHEPFADAIQSTPALAPSWQRSANRGNPDTATNAWWGANLIEMVKNGSMPEARVDNMVVHAFAAYYKLEQDEGYLGISLRDAVKIFPSPPEVNQKNPAGIADLPYLVDSLQAVTTRIQSINPAVVIDAVLNDFDLAKGYINVGGNQGDCNRIIWWYGGLHSCLLREYDCGAAYAVLYAGVPGHERLRMCCLRMARENYPADVLYASGAGTPQITYEEGLGIDLKWFDVKNITPRLE